MRTTNAYVYKREEYTNTNTKNTHLAPRSNHSPLPGLIHTDYLIIPSGCHQALAHTSVHTYIYIYITYIHTYIHTQQDKTYSVQELS